VKLFFRHAGLFSLVFLLYLSNTGLIYTVHTCIHTGASVIELPSILSDEDHCSELAEMATCNDEEDSCCKQEAEKEKDCHRHTTEYKKADLVSVKPEIKVYPVFNYTAGFDILAFFDILLPSRDRKEIHFIHHFLRAKNNSSGTALQNRIALASFLC